MTQARESIRLIEVEQDDAVALGTRQTAGQHNLQESALAAIREAQRPFRGHSSHVRRSAMLLQTKQRTLELRYAPPVVLRPQGGLDGAVSGYASAFGGPPDSWGDIIAPGAFRRTIAEHKAGGTMPAMFWAHTQSDPAGRWISMKEDAKGLYVEGVFNLESSRGRDANAHVKAGDVTGLSVGIYVPPGGRKQNADGSFTLVDVDLVEISPVAVPANRRARIDSKSELVELLQKAGLAKLAAVRVAAGGFNELNRNDNEKAAAVVARIQKAAARLKGQQ
ncbi:MAG: HK97 family phage prohead protease [Phenylobacterium sp.]|uniref:HK97 family phage prohead protease n=1 Tax=Phenylobacterium sp. TaxID=1871053 RepID=UPI0027303001|nr:HK97 family phage prohead protease [Phenylobacterium sp.]MDP2010635.1 HK97 family phage prohead protease [Phenylobacterium sp.]